ncbi:MAG: glycoside hydrolase family 3 C-terminal domain-containing protein [Caldibacillus sp.]
MEIQRTVQTITAIDFSSPWLIQEIEPYAAAFLATFGTREEALLDVIRGRYHPTGKLPITIPATKGALELEKGDVPGFSESPNYTYIAKTGDRYENGFGLSYTDRGPGALFKNFRTFIKIFLTNEER